MVIVYDKSLFLYLSLHTFTSLKHFFFTPLIDHMKIFFRIILMALVFGIVSLLFKKFIWQDSDVTATKELIKTGIVSFAFAIIMVLINKKKVQTQSSESAKNI